MSNKVFEQMKSDGVRSANSTGVTEYLKNKGAKLDIDLGAVGDIEDLSTPEGKTVLDIFEENKEGEFQINSDGKLLIEEGIKTDGNINNRLKLLEYVNIAQEQIKIAQASFIDKNDIVKVEGKSR